MMQAIIQTTATSIVIGSCSFSATEDPPRPPATPPSNMSESPPPPPLWSRIITIEEHAGQREDNVENRRHV